MYVQPDQTLSRGTSRLLIKDRSRARRATSRLSRTERRSAAPEDAGYAPEGQHQTHTGRLRSRRVSLKQHLTSRFTGLLANTLNTKV
jgi:hypothetical protein